MRTLALLLATLLTLTAAPARATVTTDPYVGTARTAPRPGDFAVGDSTMARAWDKYRAAGYHGELNGVSGRSVEDLPALVAERCPHVHPVRGAVVGLGTNGREGGLPRPRCGREGRAWAAGGAGQGGRPPPGRPRARDLVPAPKGPGAADLAAESLRAEIELVALTADHRIGEVDFDLGAETGGIRP